MTDDVDRKCRDRRWFRTISTLFAHIDGNPAHPMNGGITGLASVHCLGSMANHSIDANADYDAIKDTVTPRAYLEIHKNGHSTDEFGQWNCVVLRANRDIFPGQQILCNYEPTTSEDMWIVFGNETIVKFLNDSVAAFRGKRNWFCFRQKCNS